jgi:Tfp pilus assembly protein PilV
MGSDQSNRDKGRKRKPDKEQGFTLLDALAAIALLTVGLLAVASLHIGAIQGNSFAGRVTEGTTWAQDKLEELMALPYDDVNDDNSPEQDGGYTIAWTVLDDAGGAPSNTKLITVTVTWQDKGVTRQTQLTCLKPQV